MGAGYVAKCYKCRYTSGALMLSGGMLPQWSVSDNHLYECPTCKDFVVITEYAATESIQKAIQEIRDTGICNWSSITGDMSADEVIQCLEALVPESIRQQKEGVTCPKCGSHKIKPVNMNGRTKCPKCKRQTIEFIMDVLWD